MSAFQTLALRIVRPNGSFLEAAVDIQLKHERLTAGFERRGIQAVDEIRLTGVDQLTPGVYKVTVTPHNPDWEPQSNLSSFQHLAARQR